MRSMMKKSEWPKTAPANAEVCILAGGLSTRMGRDKARLRLGGRTLLAHVRANAKQLGLPVRVIRRDAVPRCGPLGGVVTALRSARADVVLFLSCDAPFVSAAMMAVTIERLKSGTDAVFTTERDVAGFPFVLRCDFLKQVEARLVAKEFSLQRLAATLRAKRVRVPGTRSWELFNVNTPAEWAEAKRMFQRPPFRSDRVRRS